MNADTINKIKIQIQNLEAKNQELERMPNLSTLKISDNNKKIRLLREAIGMQALRDFYNK